MNRSDSVVCKLYFLSCVSVPRRIPAAGRDSAGMFLPDSVP